MVKSLEKKIDALTAFGNDLKNLPEADFDALSQKVVNGNNWFTPTQTRFALEGLVNFLEKEKLIDWLSRYDLKEAQVPKAVGLVMAGNVPAVGFHDLLCVLLTGHHAHVKLSSSDSVLIPWILDRLFALDPSLRDMIHLEERLVNMDAYIATGSDNSARYFDYYFGKYPHIIRKNRTSVAVLEGEETQEDLELLVDDALRYFGLGCRNVSKIFFRHEGQIMDFLSVSEAKKEVINHHKYANNYDYNKSIYLVNREPHLDNGFLLLKESPDLVSPISVIYYEVYDDTPALQQKLVAQQDKIQCIVSKDAWFPGSIRLGEAQCPQLWDYADHVDTIRFLMAL